MSIEPVVLCDNHGCDIFNVGVNELKYRHFFNCCAPAAQKIKTAINAHRVQLTNKHCVSHETANL